MCYMQDTFNEMRPASSDPAYLKSSAQAVYQSMTAHDPQAVWLMQVRGVVIVRGLYVYAYRSMNARDRIVHSPSFLCVRAACVWSCYVYAHLCASAYTRVHA